MNRRRFLAGMAGLGAAAIGGCGRRGDEDTVVFRGWAYEPDIVRTNIERFEDLYPGRPVNYEAVSGNYHDKIHGRYGNVNWPVISSIRIGIVGSPHG